MVAGTFETLGKCKLATWRGWAIYSWEMGYRCALFDKKPKLTRTIIGEKFYNFSGSVEGIDPYFLRACGVDVPFDASDENFYYGEDCCYGDHPPIRIELRLPGPLLKQLGLR